jgi:hypothetical protein
LAREAAAKVDKRKTSLVEAVVLRGAHSRQSGTLRIVRSHWGNISSGTHLTVEPLEGSMCGPENIYAGERGLVLFTEEQLRQRPIVFHGFLQPYEVKAYADRGLISPNLGKPSRE